MKAFCPRRLTVRTLRAAHARARVGSDRQAWGAKLIRTSFQCPASDSVASSGWILEAGALSARGLCPAPWPWSWRAEPRRPPLAGRGLGQHAVGFSRGLTPGGSPGARFRPSPALRDLGAAKGFWRGPPGRAPLSRGPGGRADARPHHGTWSPAHGLRRRRPHDPPPGPRDPEALQSAC